MKQYTLTAKVDMPNFKAGQERICLIQRMAPQWIYPKNDRPYLNPKTVGRIAVFEIPGNADSSKDFYQVFKSAAEALESLDGTPETLCS